MTTKTFAAQMKAMIEEIKANGTSEIYCDDLISYLGEVEKSIETEPSPVEIERYKADLQNWIETNKYQRDGRLELFRSVITSGQSAIKASFLLNGGAAISVLAFVGHLAQFRPTKVPEFGACLLPFAYGVLAIAVTSGCTYLSQWLYASNMPKAQRAGFILNMLSIALGISSYGFFAWGLFATYRSFLTYA